MSTQAIIFSLCHWQSSLKTDASRKSAGLVFDKLINRVLGSDKHVMFLHDEIDFGEVCQRGLFVDVQHGAILDAAALGLHFPAVQSALNRTHSDCFFFTGC